MTARAEFGKERICPRCGKVAQERIRLGVSMGKAQSDAHIVEYCEHCQPQSFLEALLNAAMRPELGYDG
jgi:ribosomal protein L37E